ncbi:MAG: hypothetical protein EXR72_26860 [Myxococcales bacterium]|nr:hypothetical protein [Myxococcales bacterium]
MSARWLLALGPLALLAAGCRTGPFELTDGAGSAASDGAADLRPHDAMVPPDLAEPGTVLFGVNDGRTPAPGCLLQGNTVGNYAFVAVPTGAGRVRRVDLYAADAQARTFHLAVHDGGGGAQPGKVLARGAFTPLPTWGWVAARLDQPVPIGGVLWIGSDASATERWTFACPWGEGGFGVTTRVGGPGKWQAVPPQPWMFRLIGDKL